MPYIYRLPGWPDFEIDYKRLVSRLAPIRHSQGVLIGRIEALGPTLRAEATFRSLVEEVMTSSEIEGERLDRAQVRSSLARRLGGDTQGTPLGTPARNDDEQAAASTR